MTDVYVTINAPLGPIDRGDRFADPLEELLADKVRDFEITGGGTPIGKSGLTTCDIDMAFEGDADAVLPIIIAALEKLGAPKGSSARAGGKDKVVKFGSAEGVAVHVPASGEAPAISDVIDQLNSAVSGVGEFWTGWTNPTEAVLCFYGSSAVRMRELLMPVLDGSSSAHGWRFEPLT